MIFQAQTSGKHSTNSQMLTAMADLGVTINAGTDESALITLNVPNPFAQGNNFPGGVFGLQVNGTTLPATATFTYNEQSPPSTGRVPTTLCAAIPLSKAASTSIHAVWSGVRGSTVIIDSPATLIVVTAPTVLDVQ